VTALPWYLLALGIVVLIIGFLLAGLARPSRRDLRMIDPDMDDEDIARSLEADQRMPLASVVMLAGFLCILLSIGWRVMLWAF
jgi:hypothetical protein